MVVAIDTLNSAAAEAETPIPGVADGFGHETTRYLCGAVYTDGVFREEVLARGRDHYRARPPEVGVDVGMVTAHAERARRSKTVRDVVLCAPALILLFFFLTLQDEGGPDAAGLLILGALLAWLAAWVVTAFEAFHLDGVLRRTLTREAFQGQKVRPDPERDGGNVVVYGGFSPFVGSGSDLGGWSFAVDLERGKPGLNAQPLRAFDLAELYACVSDGFAALKIPNVRLSRKLFVSGRAIRSDRQFLPNVRKRPVSRLEEQAVMDYVASGSKAVRHYLCVECVDWSGELAVTFFVRFRKLSSKLFVEVSTFMLPPLKAAYYDLDKVHPKGRFKDGVGLLLAALIKAPFLLILAPIATLGRIQTGMARGAHERQQRKLIDEDLLYDFGAVTSLRELAAGTEWRVYFQKLDKEMHHKILQQQLLDGLVDFLDAHGVDTSDIKERGQHILNNGVIVSGGSINAQGLAVGEGAQAKVMGMVRRAGERAGQKAAAA
jgi:hypothetical protein